MKRKVCFSILIILIIHILTYFSFSENKLHQLISVNHEFYINDDYDSMALFFSKWNKSLKDHEKFKSTGEIRDLYQASFAGKKIKFLESKEEYRDFIYNENYLSYNVILNSTLFGISVINENVSSFKNDDLYIEAWQSSYVWVLFGWVKIERKSAGLS